MKKSMRRAKGFTLMELLIVIVVLAILAGLALPQYFGTVRRAREAEALQVLGSLRNSVMRYYAENELIPPTADLDVTTPVSELYTFADPAPGALPHEFTIVATAIAATCPQCRGVTIDQDGAITYQ